jgi:hypothetical protein
MYHARTDVQASEYPYTLISGQPQSYAEHAYRVPHGAPTLYTLRSFSNSPGSDSEGDDAMDERADWEPSESQPVTFDHLKF